LYGTSWSSTLLINNATFYKTKKDYTVVFPDHIGSKYVQVMKDYGHRDLVSHCEDDDTNAEGPLQIPGIQSLLQLEEDVFAAFDEVIDCVVYLDFKSLALVATNTDDLLE
jgi:hypothetical protein